MVLSETQWPTAFFGYPREHRVAAQTPVHKGTHGLPSEWILTLEPSVSRTRMANHQGWDHPQGDGTDSLSPETLKLLVVSNVWRQNSLLSSKRLT
jgi:hypothetical protein